jgi:large subunit ribosomal protein L6
MSRIGKKPVALPKGVKVTVHGAEAVIEGSKGTLCCPIHSGITVDVQADSINLTRINDEPQYRAFHGLTRALINNAVLGVTTGWKKELDIHYTTPEGITIGVEKNTHLTVTGIDRQLVGQVAADIRKFRKPEPYKGKGVQYTGEVIRRKAGKTGK